MATYTYSSGQIFDSNDDVTTGADTWTVNGTEAFPVEADSNQVFVTNDITQNNDIGDDVLNASYFNFTSFNFRGGNDTATLTNSFTTDFDRDMYFGTGADQATIVNSYVGTVDMGAAAAADIDMFTATQGTSIGTLSTGGGDDVISLTDSDIRNTISLSGDSLSAGTGNDSISIANSTLSGNLDAGEGNNDITITNGTNIGGDVTAGAGDDTLTASDSIINDTINLGNGTNSVDLTNVVDIYEVITGTGDDTINVTGSTIDGGLGGGGILAGDGSDIITVDSSVLTGDVEGQAGDDTINVTNSSLRDVEGGLGADYILIEDSALTGQVSGDGINQLSGFDNGDDTIIINRSTVDDDIHGGGGNDTLQLDDVSSAETIFGGDGDDTIYLRNSYLNDDVQGDNGNDLITVYNSNVNFVEGNAGNDELNIHSSTVRNDVWGGAGDDTINAFNSTVNGVVAEAGDDIIILHDVILAGPNDIEGNTGDDQVFFDNVTRTDGSDYVKTWGGEFGEDNGGDILYISVPVDANGDMDTYYILNNLTFDVYSFFGNPFGAGLAPDDANGSLVTLPTLANGYDGGDAFMFSGPELAGQYVTSDGLTIDFDEYEYLYFIPEVPDPLPPTPPVTVAPCFVRGAMIETELGSVAIENLKLGDMILTKNHGYQPLKWVGSTHADANDKHAPIKFSKGVIGNSEEIMFSPQHRILVSSSMNEILFGDMDILVPAKHFVDGTRVTVAYSETQVEYFHILFDRHETVQSSGVWSESFQPSDKNITALDEATRNEILELFPELCEMEGETNFDCSHFTANSHESTIIVNMVQKAS